MSASRDPEEVLASIRRLVAKEVQHQQEREAAERPDRDMPVVSEKASAAARRLVLGTGARIAANGERRRRLTRGPAGRPRRSGTVLSGAQCRFGRPRSRRSPCCPLPVQGSRSEPAGGSAAPGRRVGSPAAVPETEKGRPEAPLLVCGSAKDQQP